jgi:hypothetical protein
MLPTVSKLPERVSFSSSMAPLVLHGRALLYWLVLQGHGKPRQVQSCGGPAQYRVHTPELQGRGAWGPGNCQRVLGAAADQPASPPASRPSH